MFRVVGGKTIHKLVALMFAASLCVSVSEAEAATGINQQINFQGKVVNSDGTNVTNGSYTFLLCIYTTASPTTACTGAADNDAIWRESKSLTVTDGVFQTNLGDTTAFPGSVDFNTDNIYLGINFNSNGQMTPLIRFTAAPYAMNAKKVAGLTVTDTTGTLTIPNGKTVSFADAFSTTGAFPLTLTATASTTATLPSGTITLADTTTAQTLTNKTIGSTGLVFSGATTDITTASGESLVIVAAGAGTVDIQDATTVDSLTADTGGVSIASGQSYTGAGAVYLTSAAGTALTLDSGTTGAIDIGTSANAKTITLGNSTSSTGIILDKGASGNITLNDFVSCSALETNGSGNLVCGTDDTGAGGTTWDTIGDAAAAGAVAMSDWAQTLDWNTNNVTAIAMDGLTVSITNDAATDVLTQRAFVVANLNDSAATGTTETIMQVDNRDANETVGTGLLVENTGAGTMTNAIQVLGTAGAVTTGLLIADGAGTMTNGIQMTGTFTTAILDTPSLDISGTGAITGATGVSSTTGTFTSTIDARGDISDSTGNLTLNDAVDISGALAVSGTSLTATSATTITFGSTGADTIILGNGGADTITIGNAASTGVSIADNNWSVTTAGVASFITGTVIGSQTFTTNNIADSGALTIASGTASGLTLNSGTTGAINIGTDASAETLSIGTGAADKDLTLGSTTTGSTIKIQSGSASGITIEANGTATGNVQIGTGGTGSGTPDLFVLDVKNSAGDPAATKGAMYYNDNTGKFRCSENGTTFTDCIGTGGSGAPTGAQYLTLATDGTLTDERVLTMGTGLDFTDGGAGGNGTIDIDLSELASTGIEIDDTVPFTDVSASNANGKVTLEDAEWEQRKRLPNRGFNFYTDFIQETSATATDNGLAETNSGTSAATAQQAVNGTGRVGLVRSTTGTTATGRAALSSGVTAVAFNGGSWFYETTVNVTTLSTSTERYQLLVGFRDTLTAANQVDGVYFLYDEGGVSTGSTAAAYWQTATVSNSTRSFNTSLTQTTVAAATWVRLGIEINAAGTSATFYINGTAVATHTTNIPTGTARATGFGTFIIKSVGTTARTVDFDYVNVVSDWTTAR